MRRIVILLSTLALLLLVVAPAASAAIHPLIGGDHCGLNAVPGSAHSARSNVICDPPGITPDGEGASAPLPDHVDPLEAADGNAQPQFRPLFATLCTANTNAADHAWKESQGEIDGAQGFLCS